MKLLMRKVDIAFPSRISADMKLAADTLDPLPLPVPLKSLAAIYGVTPAALRKLAVKLQLRLCFMENPRAIRAWMETDNFSRGKIRKLVFDENECKRISEAVENIRYPHAPDPN